jgi:hypothetical protein
VTFDVMVGIDLDLHETLFAFFGRPVVGRGPDPFIADPVDLHQQAACPSA